MTTQKRYEMENSPELKRAKELKREGHTHLCAAVMVRGDDCLCRMEGWRLSRRKKADKLINFMRKNG